MRIAGKYVSTPALLLSVACVLGVTPISAAPSPPVGKLYVVEVSGSATIRSGDRGAIKNLESKTVYKAEDSRIETGLSSSASILLSNGSSLLCTPESRINILKFSQESIVGPITNLDKEPSVSQVQIFIERGTIAITTPELSPGSTQTYFSAQGQINVRSGEIVIGVSDSQTTVSILSGDVTARSLALDGGALLKSGSEAVLSNSSSGVSNPIQIFTIAPAQMQQVTELVASSTMARKTVLFAPVSSTSAASSANSGSGPTSSGRGKSAESQSIFDNPSTQPSQDLQPVSLVPVNLPIQLVVSPARITQ